MHYAVHFDVHFCIHFPARPFSVTVILSAQSVVVHTDLFSEISFLLKNYAPQVKCLPNILCRVFVVTYILRSEQKPTVSLTSHTHFF